MDWQIKGKKLNLSGTMKCRKTGEHLDSAVVDSWNGTLMYIILWNKSKLISWVTN